MRKKEDEVMTESEARERARGIAKYIVMAPRDEMERRITETILDAYFNGFSKGFEEKVSCVCSEIVNAPCGLHKKVAREAFRKCLAVMNSASPGQTITENEAMEPITAALLEARRQAFEEAAQITDQMTKDRNFCECYDNGDEIGKAIRKKIEGD
jgi:hypothetical protein